ncbi:DUF2683 family protein [Pedobacter frigoris]|uniref:DUF2683 family protein n=1 Tax=Pedobacter frigoris TaxID=2571272 RepID=UPI00292FCD60|nr:DUF2683 family protein [Pedobacter frigoris]
MAVKKLVSKAGVHQHIGALSYWQNICYFCSMETLIVQPKTKEQLAAIKAFLKALDIPFKKEPKIPNTATIAAMEELKAGKGKKFKSIEALFKSI